MRLEVKRVVAPLRAPFVTAWGTIDERELVLVRIADRYGGEGFGEAAPLPGYDGTSVEEVQAALDCYARILRSAGDAPRPELLVACAATADLPQALAAIDLALWDLEGRRGGLPLWQALSPAARDITRNNSGQYPDDRDGELVVEVNATVPAEDPAEVAAAVSAARAAGFGCAKVKVGLGDDLPRVAAARAAAGKEMAIRLDANGGWSVQEAIAALEVLEPYAIELCEEPVHGLDEIGRVAAASPVPIALDESAAVDGALERRVCAAACLKVARCGGISGLLARAGQARAAGYGVYLASTLDGPLGISAALHAAVALRLDFACGLATLGLFADAPRALPVRAGRMRPPPGPGLGEGLLEWYG